jgi:hypothetical protein
MLDRNAFPAAVPLQRLNKLLKKLDFGFGWRSASALR